VRAVSRWNLDEEHLRHGSSRRTWVDTLFRVDDEVHDDRFGVAKASRMTGSTRSVHSAKSYGSIGLGQLHKIGSGAEAGLEYRRS